MVKGVEIKGPAQFDSQWVSLLFTLENAEGQIANHFLDIPTTAERSYMYGAKKSLANYNNLEKFLKGFGVDLEFTEAIHQIQDLFSDPEATFVGKTISARLGYYGNHTKYTGKDGDISTYVICDKAGNPVVPTVFKGFEAADAYAKANSIKLQGFPKILDVVPAATASLVSVGGGAAVSDLPF